MEHIRHWPQALGQLFWPQLCEACAWRRPAPRQVLCTRCRATLPYTGHEDEQPNAFMARFAGRVPLHFGAALLFFIKTGRTQTLMHRLKYMNRPDIGVALGQALGERLRGSAHLGPVDAIVPVPLHPRRLFERGYNQSERFGKGLSESLGIPLHGDWLLRQRYTQTQTRQSSRLERFRNVSGAFTVPRPEALRGLHLLLVDDVLTTGATLESCAEALLAAAPDLRLSMASIAMTDA